MSAELISGRLGRDTFPAQVLGRTHTLCRADESERDCFADLLTWPALNRLLATHRLNPPRLRLARNDAAVETSQYCQARTYRRMPDWQAPIPHLLHQQLRQGATLVLDAIDEMHPPIGHMVAGLERWLGTSIQVNAYASWTAQEGFGVHWDDHDVLVLQVAGSKRWRIYGTTRPAPLHYDVAFDKDAPAEPIDEFTLQAGDILHVPRGCWHAAAASEGEPSLHLTCGLTTTTGVDFLAWLSNTMREHLHLRRDVPRFAPAVEQHAWATELARLISDRLADPAIVAEYQAHLDATAPDRPTFSLPAAVTDDLQPPTRLRLASHRARLSTDTDGVVALALNGRRWRLNAAVRPALEHLLKNDTASVADLVALLPQLPQQDVVRLLGQLLSEGAVTIAAEGS